MAETTPRVRRIDDAGEKIGGARKDWKQRSLDMSDLASMTSDEAITHVKKDNVWPQPKWDEVVSNGMPAEVAALVKAVRDSLAKEPHFTRNAEPEAVRAGYVRMMSMLRDMLMGSHSVAEVRSCYVRMLETIGRERLSNCGPEERAALLSKAHTNGMLKSPEAAVGDGLVRSDSDIRTMFFSVYTGRYAPFHVGPGHVKKANKLISEGFPGKDKVPSWRKGVDIWNAAAGGVLLVKDHRQIGGPFPDADAAWAWLERQAISKQSGEEPKKDKKEEPKRPHLDRLVREGLPDHRHGHDVTPDDFISTFGFRGVEFGNYLPDGERQQVINLAYDALLDLAHVLDWHPSRLSLDGTLAVAFGARGSGSFAAHYETGRKVLNMTRLRGAGSVAHEYAHALDHWAGEVDYAGQSRDTRGGTGWYNRIPEKDLRANLTNLAPEQVETWVRLVESLHWSELLPKEAIEHERARLKQKQAELSSHRQTLAKELALPASRQNKTYLKNLQYWLPIWEETCARISDRIARMESGEPGETVRVASDYYRESQKLCGKTGEYWKRPTEMFARGFESYVYDRVMGMGARSDYLVYGVDETRFSGPEYKGNPYPTGRERAAINAAIEAVVAAMKPRVELDLETVPKP